MMNPFLARLEHHLQLRGFGRAPSERDIHAHLSPVHYDRFADAAKHPHQAVLPASDSVALRRLSRAVSALPSGTSGRISDGVGIEVYGVVPAGDRGPWVLVHIERRDDVSVVPLWPVADDIMTRAFPRPAMKDPLVESWLLLTVAWAGWQALFAERGYALAQATAGALVARCSEGAKAADLSAEVLFGFHPEPMETALGFRREEQSVIYAMSLSAKSATDS
jgi:hypothetical protein